MRAPLLHEWLAACGARILDHAGCAVEPATFRLGIEARLLDPRRRGKAGTDDGHSIARSDFDDVESEIELAGGAVEDLGEVDRSGRMRRRTRATFADMSAVLQPEGSAVIGVSPVAFADAAAKERAQGRHQRIAGRLGLRDLRHGTVRAAAAGTASDVRIRGGRPAWTLLQQVLDDLAGDARDFVVGGDEVAANLTLAQRAFRTKGPTYAITVGPSVHTTFVDRSRRSRGGRAAAHAVALLDPACLLDVRLEPRQGSATLEASLRRRDDERTGRIAAFLEASEADAGLVAAWKEKTA